MSFSKKVYGCKSRSALDSGLEPRPDQSKDYKIGICCFFAKNAALRNKSKDWITQLVCTKLTMVIVDELRRIYLLSMNIDYMEFFSETKYICLLVRKYMDVNMYCCSTCHRHSSFLTMRITHTLNECKTSPRL
jgi:hypothetical protein